MIYGLLLILFLALTLPLHASTVVLTWTAAIDDVSAPANLVYEVRQSLAPNISTVADAEVNGTIVLPYGAGRETATIFNLEPGRTFFFNVIVKDEAGRKAAYRMTSVTTPPPEKVNTLWVRFVVPLNNTKLPVGNVPIKLSAGDEIGVTRLELRFNGNVQAWWPGGGLSVSAGVYSYKWQTQPYKGRTVTLEGRAYDVDGHVVISSESVVVAK